MASLKVTEEVAKIVTPFLESKGLRVYDVVFVKEASEKVLRLYIDLKGGSVSIDMCEEVTRYLSDKLDEIDLIEEAYVLEVSSPGIERQLKYDWHFDENIGKKVSVKLYNKLNGKKVVVGELVKGSEKGDVTIKIDEDDVVIPRSNIIDVKIYFEFGGK